MIQISFLSLIDYWELKRNELAAYDDLPDCLSQLKSSTCDGIPNMAFNEAFRIKFHFA